MTIIWCLFFCLFLFLIFRSVTISLGSLSKLAVCFDLSLANWEVVIFNTISKTCPLLFVNTWIPFINNKCLFNRMIILREISWVLKINSGIELWWVDKLVDENLQLITILCAVDYRMSIIQFRCVSFSGLIYHWLSDGRVNLSYFFLEWVDFQLSQVAALHVLWDKGMILKLFHGDSVCLIWLKALDEEEWTLYCNWFF